MLTEIPTEFEELEPPFDDGVKRGIRAEEDFVHHGEKVHRETEIRLLEDGGVHIVQQVQEQNIYDSLTLNGAVANRLWRELSEER